MKYNVGSLFAGVGGICLGFKRASENFNLVVANEWDKEAAATYEYNFDHSLVRGDIERILSPGIAEREQEFLLKRKSELDKITGQKEADAEEKKFQKKQTSSLKWSYLLKCLNGSEFRLSEKTEEKFEKDSVPEEEREGQRNSVEYYLVSELLEERKGEWLKKEVSQLEEKRSQLLAQRLDILTAGFPCQAFSIAGGRKGFTDHRGELFYSVLELVKQLEESGHGKPRVLFLENVKNLVSHDEGRTFKVITEEIEKMGYSVKHHKVFNTYEYTDLPQNRERIFVVCFRDKEDEINFGSMEDIVKKERTRDERKNSLSQILDYTLTKETAPDLYYTKEKYPNYFQYKYEFDEDDEKRINLDEQMTEMYEVYQIRRGMYVRKNQSGVCPTLTANMGTGGHNVPLIKMRDGIRKLSPKDCFNLQGFRVGEDFKLPPMAKNAPLYKQAGNAVSVDMVQLLAKKIMDTFVKSDPEKNNEIQAVAEENTVALKYSFKIKRKYFIYEKCKGRFKYFKKPKKHEKINSQIIQENEKIQVNGQEKKSPENEHLIKNVVKAVSELKKNQENFSADEKKQLKDIVCKILDIII